MWGGIDFYVAVETLISFTVPAGFAPPSVASSASSSSIRGAELTDASAKPTPGETPKYPGNPAVRRVEFAGDRRRTTLFVYPNATLFLQLLCSSGNRVHLLTPWSKENTALFLRSSEWANYLADTRHAARVPGSARYHFGSLGIDPASYLRTVLVVENAARWSSATSLQLVEVQHEREGQAAFRSMELLYALSRCIFYAEWLLRYPQSTIASGAALSATTVFSYCRFYLYGGDNGDGSDDGASVDAELMRLLSFHGGRLVHAVGEATHIVVLPPTSVELSSSSAVSSSSASTTSSSEEEDDSAASSSSSETDISLVDSSSGDSEADTDDGGDSNKRGKRTVLVEVPESAKPPRTASLDAASPATTSTAPAAAAASCPRAAVFGTGVPVVTPRWVHRCIRALRLVPIVPATEAERQRRRVEDGDEEAPWEDAKNAEGVCTAGESEEKEAEMARTTGLLLCTLLPPADARPLLWSTFRAIAHQHHYSTAAFAARRDDSGMVRSGDGDAKSASSSGVATSNGLQSPSGLFVLPTVASVLEELTGPLFKEVVETRLLPPGQLSTRGANSSNNNSSASSPASARLGGTVVTQLTLETLKLPNTTADLSRVAMHRLERRRDREAVFAHLQLLASQFAYSYDFVLRKRMRQSHCDAGTQTSGPLHASVGVMTDTTSEIALPNDEGTNPAKSVVEVRARTDETRVPPPVAMDAVDEDGWRHHLKNVEGRLLFSPEHSLPATQRNDEPNDAQRLTVESANAKAEERNESRGDNERAERHRERRRHKLDAIGNDDGWDGARAAAAIAAHAEATVEAVEFPQQRPASDRMVGAATNDASALSPALATARFGSPLSRSFDPTTPPAPSAEREASVANMAALVAGPSPSVESSKAGSYTACFIPTVSLGVAQLEDEFFGEISTYPIFTDPELGNAVMLLPDGVKCVFTSHDAAEDFLRLEYIEFRSIPLPIYPFLGEEQRNTRPVPAEQTPRMPRPADGRSRCSEQRGRRPDVGEFQSRPFPRHDDPLGRAPPSRAYDRQTASALDRLRRHGDRPGELSQKFPRPDRSEERRRHDRDEDQRRRESHHARDTPGRRAAFNSFLAARGHSHQDFRGGKHRSGSRSK